MSAARKEDAAPGGGLKVTDAEIDAVILEAASDPREAIRMLLQDLGTLALDADAAASRGFLRGLFSEGARRRPDEGEGVKGTA